MSNLLDFLSEFYILDVLDVLIVAFLFYRLYLIVRGTRASEMFVGLGILFSLSLVAQALGLLLLNRIIVSLQTVWLIAFIILFQPELRRALGFLGQTRVARRLLPQREPKAIDELVKAVERLRRSGLGAIIVLAQTTGLKTFVEKGTVLDSRISAALLETIFTPPTPLHDGAVIIRGDSLVAAGCILPLSENQNLAYTLGTRHRAALGLSEQTDAAVIVVSEESRKVSLAEKGVLRRGLKAPELREELRRIYGVKAIEDALDSEIPEGPLPKTPAS